MWKVVISSNLNLPLKLYFYLPKLTNNNLLLKIYCENIMIVFFNQDFLIFYIIFLSFHFHPYMFHFFFFLFSFSCFSPPRKCPVSYLYPPLLLFSFSPQEHSSNLTIYFTSEKREREREEKDCCSFTDSPPVEIEVTKRTKRVKIGVLHVALPRTPPHSRSSSSTPLSWVRSACSFFFSLFFFSYLLVLIQLYFKNWILFCVLCLDYVRNGENERKKEIRRREKELI